jgi:hypothetical protein
MTAEDTPPPAAPPPGKRPWYRNRWLIGGAAALGVYTLAGFFLVPYLVRHYVPKIAAETFQRQAAIGEVRFNPFLFRLEASDFAFRDTGGEPMLAIERLLVDFELSSLTRWAWTFAEIRVEGPALDLVIGEDNRLNLARVLDAMPPADPAEPPREGPLPRMVIAQATLAGGKVSFTDRSNPTHATATLEPVDLDFKEISTLPERRGPYAVTARLPGGGSVAWQGEVSLHPVASSGTVRVEGFKPATAWKFLQDRVRLTEPKGDLDVAVTYRFAYAAGVTTLTADPIKASVRDLALTEEDATVPMLELAAIELPAARFDLAARELVVPQLAVRDGRAAASVARDGTVNWATLAKDAAVPQPAATPAAPADTGAPWKVRVESLSVDNLALDYQDASRAVPVRIAVASSALTLNAQAEAGGDAPRLVLDAIQLTVREVAWTEAESGAPLLALQEVAAAGGRLDLAENDLRLQRVTVTGGEIRVNRSAEGVIRHAEVFGPAEGKVQRELAQARSEAAAEGRPWTFALDEFALTGFTVGFTDQGTQPPLQADLEKIDVTLKDLRNDGKTPFKADARAQLRQGGGVSATATVGPGAESVDAQLKLARVTLTPLGPLAAKFTTLKLESGDVSGAARIAYRADKGGPQLKVTGAVAMGNLLLNEADTGERFLAWKSLSANGVDFRLGPDRLAIEEVRLVQPGAKIVIFEDRSVNLAKVVKREEAPPAEAAAPAQGGAGAAPFPVSVERVRVENGTVDFADLSLVLPFATRVKELNGAATGIASDPASRASLKFEGRVDEFGEAAVDGSLAPFAPKTFTDIGVAFRNVAMTPFSPYSATFAGRKIASGKLSLDLQYKIDNSELQGENKVVLQEFTLGEKVESPDAVSLPLDLAIALLTDSQGKIDLAVPVSGNVDSPEFSYGHVVWQAVVNVITKIVTAPFRALGAALGGDAEGLDSVAFAPGRAELSPPERERLKKVAEALAKRPQLQLTVRGGVDPAADGAALKERALRAALAQKLGVKLEPGEDPGPVAYDNAKTQRALEALAAERGGATALADFQAAFEKSAGRPAKRVNPALALVGQASDDRDFYVALFASLMEKAPAPEAELQALAENRAAAVVQALTATAGLDPARVAAGKPQTAESRERAVPSKLELGVKGGV